MQRDSPLVFLSYSRSDKKYVSKLAQWLAARDVTVWFDHEIEHGSKWEVTILEKLKAASAVIVVMSTAAGKSSWVEREVRLARRRRIPVLPLMLELNEILHSLRDLQVENVVGGEMPSLRYCEQVPGFLVSQADLAAALSPEQKALAQRLTGGRSLRAGQSGPLVAALQAELIRVGLDPGPLDGVFGEATRQAVRQFQARRCHTAVIDGQVGILTMMTLLTSTFGDLAGEQSHLSSSSPAA